MAKITGAVYLRVDTVEQGIRDFCHLDVEGEGYRLSYRIADDNLRLGNSVIADSCNPIELTRREWADVAMQAGARFVNIEVICSDPAEHQRRVETRRPSVKGLKLPSWHQIETREYHPWDMERVVIDTAGKTVSACVTELADVLVTYN